MEFYAELRRCVYVEGLSERAAARRFGLARETDGAQDAALLPAAGVSPDAADPVSETGRFHGDHRSDPAFNEWTEIFGSERLTGQPAGLIFLRHCRPILVRP